MKTWPKNFLTYIFTKQAAAILAKYNPKVIVVVGSVGKTSTKLAVAKVLTAKFRVQYENGNYNVPLSVPFAVTGQRLPNLHSLTGWFRAWRAGQAVLKKGFNFDVVVLEYGIDHKGEMMEFAKICRPDIAVLTAIAPEHMEYFESLENVAKEELAVTNFADNLLVNSDTTDSRFIEQFASKTTTIKYYGFSGTDYLFESTAARGGFLGLAVTTSQGAKVCQTTTKMLGVHSLSSLGVAAIVASQLGMQPAEIEQTIAGYNSPAGRMSILKGQNNSTIIDDTYNSSPTSAIAALKTLYTLPASKKIALLGNMNELGGYSKHAHQEVGKYCAKQQLDLVVTLGADANKYLAEAAIANGCRVIKTTNPVHAGRLINAELIKGSVVLAKGSQNGVYAEEAVKLLLADTADGIKLVRQSKDWLVKKRQQFPDIN